MKPGYDSRPRVPAATPKRDAVRLRMFETTWWQLSEWCGWKKGCVRCEVHPAGRWVALTYLGVVLHAGDDDGVDGQLPFFSRRHGGCGFGVVRRSG